MNKPRKKSAIFAIVVAGITLFTAITLSRAEGLSFATILNRLYEPIQVGDTAVAIVNGQQIELEALERQKAIYQGNNQDAYDEIEAYRASINIIIRDVVLHQEAERRGISVTEDEARAYYAHVLEAIDKAPEGLTMLQDIQKTSGLSDQEFEAMQIETYQALLSISRVQEAIRSEAPLPTEEEIDVYLAKMPGPNFLVLMPIKFTDLSEARSTYSELRELAANQTPAQFITTFDGYVRRLGDRGPTEFVHEKFRYADAATELPDYAQDAVGKPKNSMVWFERADGTAVISFIVDSETVKSETVRQAALQSLLQQKQWAYQMEMEEQLVRQAKVEILHDNLPPTARAALTDWTDFTHIFVNPLPDYDATPPPPDF